MQVADNFLVALFAGTPGLDGRDGIPGEPGLDGIPGEFYRMPSKNESHPSVMVLFDSQAETAWTASREPMEFLVSAVAKEHGIQNRIVNFVCSIFALETFLSR